MKAVSALTRIAIGLLLLVSSVASLSAHEDENELKTLLAVQTKVKNTVQQVTPAVVSISDGVGFGSGVVINEDGLILTAGHVVNNGGEEFTIYFPSGVTTQARLIGYNLDVDSAMLQITEKGKWPHAKLSEGQCTKVGDWVVCLGHSGGYELGRLPPVRTGKVLEFREHQLVTDAVLIGGDSGGPLFDLDGNVVGIHSSIGDSIAENRHVTVTTFRADWSRLAAGERWGHLPDFDSPDDSAPPAKKPAKSSKRKTAKLGVILDDNPDQAIVKEVEPSSVAGRVGIRAGDSIVSFDGRPITRSDDLLTMVQGKATGESVSIELRRRGQVLKLQVILDDLK
jgi:serine protease Do